MQGREVVDKIIHRIFIVFLVLLVMVIIGKHGSVGDPQEGAMHCKEGAVGKIDSVKFNGGVDGDFIGRDGFDVLVVGVVVVAAGGGGGLVADRVAGDDSGAVVVETVPDVVVMSGGPEELRRP